MARSDDVTIRPATVDDLDSIAGFWEELLELHHRLDGRFWKRAPDGREKYREWMHEALSAEDRALLVAQMHEKVVGFAHGMLKKSPPPVVPLLAGFVTDLFVSEPCRRVGVGRRLIEAAEEWFLLHGAGEMTLTTAVCNVPAVAFWRAMGFEPWTCTMWKPLTRRAGAPF
jgi:ribosomal protein S18 acetylase RimI-like enzyme